MSVTRKVKLCPMCRKSPARKGGSYCQPCQNHYNRTHHHAATMKYLRSLASYPKHVKR